MNSSDNGKTPSESKEQALHYFNSLVQVARESVLILDSSLTVVSANPTFYQNFKVTPKETENVLLYDLGNGQWNIPELRKLLKEILPDKKVVKDYEVSHIFETLGQRTMLINASQIDSVQLIILAIEDVSEKEALQAKLRDYTENLENLIMKRTEELAQRVMELERINSAMVGRELKMVELKAEIDELKKGASK
ncbi:hypothetical protein A3A70_02095 [candidate division WWE3 bacterium RIFCSPLOWO2_01_FULL_42_11]|uniref:PAS fold-4 domain-containing protein n=1 Tax=candidate division WWE3 bacterium RIFCSPLOWO2_01_FULL_42_11 TaxID=1802627 RepID=A0A1F4VPW7_UNCKA|nr:MAG: hypothetical protein A3A70_02095 [candidate division WWE3 bacterium RIFCSPLOWO2_01_FULL_42_11]